MTARQWFDETRAALWTCYRNALAICAADAMAHWLLALEALTTMHDDWERTH